MPPRHRTAAQESIHWRRDTLLGICIHTLGDANDPGDGERPSAGER
jgi:hypothetical protein